MLLWFHSSENLLLETPIKNNFPHIQRKFHAITYDYIKVMGNKRCFFNTILYSEDWYT
jgi:hypothetical protein